MQFNIELLLITGMFPSKTVGFAGVQGVTVFGIQGTGVKTPIAAEVAEITAGFAGDWHIPKGRILTMGMLSIIFAPGIFSIITLFFGNTIILLGAIPKLHVNIAPLHTPIPIIYPLFYHIYLKTLRFTSK